jgi:phenylpropionate dioxygenase-like ring-hydroxylating dioxygenase large terminal subunit
MELVRDVVRALEEEIMDGFDENANKPVSAAFTTPIPASTDEPTPRRRKSRETDDDTQMNQLGVQRPLPQPNSSVHHDDEEGEEAFWPVMEMMSQDAIEEMVEKMFTSVDREGNGLISFDEFKRFVEHDTTMIAWFEALGMFDFLNE